MPRPSVTHPRLLPPPPGMPAYPYPPQDGDVTQERYREAVQAYIDAWSGRNFRIPNCSYLELPWPTGNRFIEKGGVFRFRRVGGGPYRPGVWKIERVEG